MAKIKIVVEGGKASAGPAMAQTLGPMKINMQDVLGKINEKTKDFAGVKVPVEVDVNEKTKEFEISVGSPGTGELIKKELNIKKGSGTPDKTKVGNLSVEQLIKIAKMKKDGLFTENLKSAMKGVAGTCNSLGVLVEGKVSNEFNKDLDSGKYDQEIKEEKTETSKEKLDSLKEQMKEVQVKLDALVKKKSAKEEKKEEKKEEAEGTEEKKEEKKDDKKPAAKAAGKKK